MIFSDDDDDIYLSPSDSMSFESPENAKNKRKEERAKSEGKLFALKRMLLRGKVENKNNEINEDNENNDPASSPIGLRRDIINEENESTGTKTLKQMEEENIIYADETPTTDQLIEKSHQTEERREDLNQETASEDV